MSSCLIINVDNFCDNVNKDVFPCKRFQIKKKILT